MVGYPTGTPKEVQQAVAVRTLHGMTAYPSPNLRLTQCEKFCESELAKQLAVSIQDVQQQLDKCPAVSFLRACLAENKNVVHPRKKQKKGPSQGSTILNKIRQNHPGANAGSDAEEQFSGESDTSMKEVKRSEGSTGGPTSFKRRPFRDGLSEAFYEALFAAIRPPAAVSAVNLSSAGAGLLGGLLLHNDVATWDSVILAVPASWLALII